MIGSYHKSKPNLVLKFKVMWLGSVRGVAGYDWITIPGTTLDVDVLT